MIRSVTWAASLLLLSAANLFAQAYAPSERTAEARAKMESILARIPQTLSSFEDEYREIGAQATKVKGLKNKALAVKTKAETILASEQQHQKTLDGLIGNLAIKLSELGTLRDVDLKETTETKDSVADTIDDLSNALFPKDGAKPKLEEELDKLEEALYPPKKEEKSK